MTHKQALQASKHNPKGVMRALEGLDVECYRCAGTGIQCYVCGGEKRIKYSYQPQVGEWCIWEDKVRLIENVIRGNVWCVYNELAVPTWEEANKVTPILPWETIEEILEKAGYETKLRDIRILTGEHSYSISWYNKDNKLRTRSASNKSPPYRCAGVKIKEAIE